MAELAAPGVLAAFVSAVRDFAIEDAALVAQFLAHAFPGREIESERFPAEVLQRLAVILRLREWEQRQITCHLEAGLPAANDLLEKLILELESGTLSSVAARLHPRVLRMLHQSILWDTDDATVRFRVEIRMDLQDEVLDHLAELLIHLYEETDTP